MAFQDARQSKFEADFKQQQSEITNKIDIVLKAITDQIADTLPSDTVKNPKLSTYPVLSACSYPTIDAQCSSHPFNSINANKAHFKKATISQISLWQPKIETEPEQLEDPEPTLKDESQDLHLNLLKDPENPLLVGRGFLAIANAVIDCRMAKIAVGEGITRSVFRVKGVDFGEEEAPYFTTLGKRSHTNHDLSRME
ncbi:hypothetical protein Tco_0155776 [Tanacetum coccineum]